jgi:hypothetical protein
MIIADEVVIIVFIFLFLALVLSGYFMYNIKRKSDVKIATLQNPVQSYEQQGQGQYGQGMQQGQDPMQYSQMGGQGQGQGF